MSDLDDGRQEEREKGTYCEICNVTGFWMRLGKCPMCHRYFCDSCRYTYGGKDFCSRHCGNEFFWGGEDGDVEE